MHLKSLMDSLSEFQRAQPIDSGDNRCGPIADALQKGLNLKLEGILFLNNSFLDIYLWNTKNGITPVRVFPANLDAFLYEI